MKDLSIGIVGLPNVGKSTLFNALLKKQQALVANYPFATIEPNIGVVGVPDPRLDKLAEVIARGPALGFPPASAHSRFTDSALSGNPSSSVTPRFPPIVPATVNFVDIAGLVKGASEGAGLGNKFLSHIREVSVIAHVVRAFEDSNIICEGSVGVREDYETVRTELMLADLQSAQNQESRIKNNGPQKSLFQKIIAELNKGVAVRNMDFTDEERGQVKNLFFLTIKPEIIVLNVGEENYSEEKFEKQVYQYTGILGVDKEKMVVVSAKIEAELAALSEEEQKEYLFDLGLKESGLERLIKKAYTELGLISFLTAGEKEVRAWTIRKGSTALEASGEIHTDFMKKFIKAEVVHYQDFIEFGGWKGSREHGKEILEGRDYIVRDGDMIEFKIGS